MSIAEMSFYTVCIAVQSVCILSAIFSLYRSGKIRNDVYNLMVKELWSLRGLTEKTSSSGSGPKDSGNVDGVLENLHDTAKEPGTKEPKRDDRIPIGPTDI